MEEYKPTEWTGEIDPEFKGEPWSSENEGERREHDEAI